MRNIFYIFIILLLTSSGYAQIYDTTLVQNSQYTYFVIEKDSLGNKTGPISYFDKQNTLLKTVGFKETTWYTYYENSSYNYSVFRRDDKNQVINPVKFYDANDSLVISKIYKNDVIILITYYDKQRNKRLVLPYKNGQFHGTSYSYHANGNIEWTKGYKKGKLSGERILRDSIGGLVTGENKYTAPYTEAPIVTQCVNGRPNGKFTVPFTDGGVNYAGQYDVGYPSGEFIYYDKKGNVTRIDIYKKGKFKKSINK